MLDTVDVREPVLQRPGAGHFLLPVTIGVLAVLGTIATYRVFVRTISGQWLDTAAMLGTDVQHPRVEDILSRTMNATSLTSLVLACVVAAVVGVARRRVDLAVAAAVLVLAANGTTQLLKSTLTRPPFDGLPYPNSLPSGHVTAAASVAFALVLVLPAALKGVAALAGAGYTAAIAIGTVWAQWHRPSDVIAATLVVLGYGALVVLAVRLIRRRPAGRPSRLAWVPLLATAASTVPVTVLGLLLGKASESMTTLPEPSRLTFLTGATGVAAVVATGFLAWLWLTPDDAD